jgi:hypothetical protein
VLNVIFINSLLDTTLSAFTMASSCLARETIRTRYGF